MAQPQPKYIGDCSWGEMDGADITKNEFEIDVLVRPFMGPKSTFDQWIKGYPKYSPDYQYRSMARSVFQTKGLAGGMMQVNIQYKGLIDGVPPTILPVSDVTIKAVKLTTDNADDGEIEFQYYAPVTKYRYVNANNDGNPQYGAPLSTNLNITPFNPRPPEYSGKLQYDTIDIVEGFRKEQQGLWFTYEVDTATILIPLGYLAPEIEPD